MRTSVSGLAAEVLACRLNARGTVQHSNPPPITSNTARLYFSDASGGCGGTARGSGAHAVLLGACVGRHERCDGRGRRGSSHLGLGGALGDGDGEHPNDDGGSDDHRLALPLLGPLRLARPWPPRPLRLLRTQPSAHPPAVLEVEAKHSREWRRARQRDGRLRVRRWRDPQLPPLLLATLLARLLTGEEVERGGLAIVAEALVLLLEPLVLLLEDCVLTLELDAAIKQQREGGRGRARAGPGLDAARRRVWGTGG